MHAKQGDLGSKVLPPNPTGVVWKAGGTVETKWNIRANHGGGCKYSTMPRAPVAIGLAHSICPRDVAAGAMAQLSIALRSPPRGRALL